MDTHPYLYLRAVSTCGEDACHSTTSSLMATATLMKGKRSTGVLSKRIAPSRDDSVEKVDTKGSLSLCSSIR
eukprot:755148-Pleurochrysis_carterae.AAC.2